jgi:hypothetical protein
MATITITPVGTDADRQYRATGSGHESLGRAAGAALDALAERIGQTPPGPLVVLNRSLPDRFFGAEQGERLRELVALDQEARAGGRPMSSDEQAELRRLIDAELEASAAWAAATADQLGL